MAPQLRSLRSKNKRAINDESNASDEKNQTKVKIYLFHIVIYL